MLSVVAWLLALGGIGLHAYEFSLAGDSAAFALGLLFWACLPYVGSVALLKALRFPPRRCRWSYFASASRCRGALRGFREPCAGRSDRASVGIHATLELATNRPAWSGCRLGYRP
jgi:hypothetical protein